MANAGPQRAANDEAGKSRELVFLGVTLALSVAVLGYLHLAHGVALDEATLALSIACAVLLYALRALFRVVVALAQPPVELLIAGDDGRNNTLGELRDERRRVLRAIKELDFDYEMGKLVERDYQEIRDRFRLRAVELKREIDGASDLHPDLAEMLERIDRGRGCSKCATENDWEARFCKGCGQPVGAETEDSASNAGAEELGDAAEAP